MLGQKAGIQPNRPFALLLKMNSRSPAARKKFATLSQPLIIKDWEAYTDFWVYEEKLKSRNRQAVRPLDSQSSDLYISSLAAFFKKIPLDSIYTLQKEPAKALTQNQTLLKAINVQLGRLVAERNRYARQKGYANYVDYFLPLKNITALDLQAFLLHIDPLIKQISAQIVLADKPQEFFAVPYQVCFLCALRPLPQTYSTPALLDLAAKLYPQIAPFTSKIQCVPSNRASTRYVKETDQIEITFRQNVNRWHQMVDLGHELGHAVSLIDDFAGGINPLTRKVVDAEYAAYVHQLAILNYVDKTIIMAQVGNFLLTIQKALFEISLYTSQPVDPSVEFARQFNRVFPSAKLSADLSYTLDHGYITAPLAELPHAIAIFRVLTKRKVV